MNLLNIFKFLTLFGAVVFYRNNEIMKIISSLLLITFSIIWLYDSLNAKQMVEVLASVITQTILWVVVFKNYKVYKTSTRPVSDEKRYNYENNIFDENFIKHNKSGEK